MPSCGGECRPPSGEVATAFRWEAPRRLGRAHRVPLRLLRQRAGPAPPPGPAWLERAAQLGGRGRRAPGRRAAADERRATSGRRRPWVTGAVAEANAAQGRYRFEVVDLARWLDDERAEAPDDDLPVWRGELRSAARAPLLAGVISNRVDVRAAAAAAERAVERRAEPLLALFRPAGGVGGGRRRSSRWPGTGSSPTAPTTRPAPAAPTPSPTRCWSGTPRPARSATPWPTRRWPTWPPRRGRPPARCSW